MVYLLKVNVLLAVFYGFYRLLFVRDTFFGWRRVALLLMMAAAVLMPLVDISWWVASHEQTASLSEVYREVVLPTVTITGSASRFPWVRLFTLLYISGVLAFSARMMWQLGTLVKLINTSSSFQGMSIRLLRDESCPFSFFRWIFVNPEAQTEEQLQEIITHEQAHVEQRHSIDVVLMELLTIACWPNPFVWLMRREVRLNLEYLADERVVEAGSERKAYQYHLLGLAYGKNVATVCNNFNVLPLKLRIRMMNKKRTNSWLRAKYLLLVPVIGVALVACNLDKKTAEPATADEQPEVVSLNEDAIEADVQAGQDAAAAEEGVFDVVEKMPEFPGGQEALMNFLQKNVKYPKEAMDKGTQGRVVVQFVVGKDGSVTNPKVVKSVSPELDQEALRVVKMMPKWQPGKQKGEEVPVRFTIPVSFMLR
ncbi:MAG: M56 family metallopeptidase [Prevotella sp.]|nr:M56 family metallopeptidase [Prevotella sp.]